MIRVGIVGTGGMAGGHAARFSQMKGVKVVAACDVVLERAKAFAARFAL